MDIINALKQYNSVFGKLKRLQARIEVIDSKIDYAVKSSVITDMPIAKNEVNCDTVGVIVCKIEELKQEKHVIEIEIKELNSFIIDIDTVLNCMKYTDAWLLKKKYIERKPNFIITREYNKDIGILERSSIDNKLWELKKMLRNKHI